MATELERIEKLEQEQVQMKVDIAVAKSDIKNVQIDINSIKDDTRWIRRAFTGAIITAIVGGIIGLAFALITYVSTK